MKLFRQKKAGEPITKVLPFEVILIIAAVIILLLVYTIWKGGLAFIASPPTTKLPI